MITTQERSCANSRTNSPSRPMNLKLHAVSLEPQFFVGPNATHKNCPTRFRPAGAYEIKHDGFRFICRRDGERVRVFSRRGNDFTDRVPRIAEALGRLRVKSVTIDGEGVVCGPDGVSDFDRLRAAVGRLGSRDAFRIDIRWGAGADPESNRRYAENLLRSHRMSS